ncbi:MAG TPA: hypothetical protein VF746_12570 [Longimicrobium sp.]|jgi:hypothetical protein
MQKCTLSSGLFCAGAVALMLAVVAGVPDLRAQTDHEKIGGCANGDRQLCQTTSTTTCNADKTSCTTTTTYYYYFL